MQKRSRQQQSGTGKVSLLLLCFSLLAVLSACSADKKKTAVIVTDVGRIEKALAHIARSYEARDAAGLSEGLDANSKTLGQLRENAEIDFGHFSEAELRFVIDRVEIKEASLMTALRWTARWKKNAATPALEKRGNVLFFWTNRKNPLLTQVRGDSPFGVFKPRN